jgi:hypothetical protein
VNTYNKGNNYNAGSQKLQHCSGLIVDMALNTGSTFLKEKISATR